MGLLVWNRQRHVDIQVLLCRHLQRNPDNQLYPLFEYFENWCQVRLPPVLPHMLPHRST